MSDETNTKVSDIFLSYNKADVEWVQQLASLIENETIDGTVQGRKLTVFFAPWDIEFGANFVNEINSGLRRARFFAPILTPEFFSSGWTNFEWTDQVSLGPLNKGNRMIPILRRDLSLDGTQRISLPAPFNVLNRLDFREGQSSAASFTELIRIIQGRPKSRGKSGSATVLYPDAPKNAVAQESVPDDVPELLISNLLKIESLPFVIWSGNTSLRSSAEVFELTQSEEPFILHDKRLFTFSDLSDSSGLRKALSDTPNIISDNVAAWRLDKENQKLLIRLLNSCVRKYARTLRIGMDEKKRFYFWPDYVDSRDGSETSTPVTRNIKLAGDNKPRAVAALKKSTAGDTFWVHYAARIRTEVFDGQFYLSIEPTFIFTSDGRHALDGKSVGKLAIQWTGKQQNVDVLRATLFWVRALASSLPNIQVPAGEATVNVQNLPCLSKTNFGIGGDYVRVAALLEEQSDVLDIVALEAEGVDNDWEEFPDEDQDAS